MAERFNRLFALICVLLLASGCDSEGIAPGDGTGDSPILVTAQLSASTVSVSAPITVTIRLENVGDQQIVWGAGSSGCRLWVRVLVDEIEYPADDLACVTDYIEYSLQPGGVDTTNLEWNGRILRDGEMQVLAVGSYDLIGLGVFPFVAVISVDAGILVCCGDRSQCDAFVPCVHRESDAGA